MNTISITEFKGYDATAIKEYLLLQPGNEYQVIIPKESASPADPNDYVIQEYFTAMYTGQKLAAIAINFGYNVPCPYIPGQFLFDIEIVRENVQPLSELLHQVITGYTVPPEANNEIAKAFHKDALDFFVRTDGAGDIVPECIGHWAICEKFFDYDDMPQEGTNPKQ